MTREPTETSDIVSNSSDPVPRKISVEQFSGLVVGQDVQIITSVERHYRVAYFYRSGDHQLLAFSRRAIDFRYQITKQKPNALNTKSDLLLQYVSYENTEYYTLDTCLFRKIVFTGTIPLALEAEDNGQALLVGGLEDLQTDGDDDGAFFVRLCSWRNHTSPGESGEVLDKSGRIMATHPTLEGLKGRRVRITVEVLDEPKFLASDDQT